MHAAFRGDYCILEKGEITRFGYINVIDPVVKRMAQQGRGAIVNIVAWAARWPAPPTSRVAQRTLH